MEPTRDDLLKALGQVIDPELRRPVTELDMVRAVDVAGGDVRVTIALTVAGCPLRASFEDQVRELNEEYQRRNCPYQIVADGAGYRMLLREKYSKSRDRFYGQVRAAREIAREYFAAERVLGRLLEQVGL